MLLVDLGTLPPGCCRAIEALMRPGTGTMPIMLDSPVLGFARRMDVPVRRASELLRDLRTVGLVGVNYIDGMVTVWATMHPKRWLTEAGRRWCGIDTMVLQ